MDISLPGMDGKEATRWLRADPRFASLPIVAVTAHAMKEDRQKCLDAGCDDHMTKPVDREKLVAIVAKHTLTEQAHAETAAANESGARPASAT